MLAAMTSKGVIASQHRCSETFPRVPESYEERTKGKNVESDRLDEIVRSRQWFFLLGPVFAERSGRLAEIATAITSYR